MEALFASREKPMIRESRMSRERIYFHRFSWALLVYCLVIILWGAFVRISGSGDGCGDYWPLCHGQWIPSEALANQIQTWIELFHRLKSGLFGVIVLISLLWAFRFRSKAPRLWKASFAVFVLTTIEALIGAGLVLFGWVGEDDSLARMIAMSLHLGNTLFLVAALTAQVYFSARTDFQFRRLRKEAWILGGLLIATAITGAWAALSSTLYPSESLLGGLLSDFSSDSPWILRLRILHPVLAIVGIPLFLKYFASLPSKGKEASFCFIAYWLHLGFGFLTLLLLAPVWMKLSHLFLANAFWISFIWLVFCESFLRTESSEPPQRTSHLS
jgi:cytochrome c oxidase assembly protein subunit 15